MRDAWRRLGSGGAQQVFLEKLQVSSTALHTWGKSGFNERRDRIKDLEHLLEVVRKGCLTASSKNRESLQTCLPSSSPTSWSPPPITKSSSSTPKVCRLAFHSPPRPRGHR
ncbi:hypothetical protein Salat_2066600 [Sesamum alatum]|uniref:Uncharacterized protein n=1 Tax=Sesamum alatum TaxID=300844 RepID=A0AAE2CGA9_9LAMI|nr:hypothetical protein Salat_2066600 [Sesamum alatum]